MKLIEPFCRALNRASWKRESPLLFMHIPKCAGTSVYSELHRLSPSLFNGFICAAGSKANLAMLYSCERPWRVGFKGNLYLYRQLLALDCLRSGAKVISGHIPMGGKFLDACNDLSPEAEIITVMRDPIKRWRSHFLYHLEKTGGTAKCVYDLDRSLYNEPRRALHAALEAPGGESERRVYLDYFSGAANATSPDLTTAEAERLAEASVKRFTIFEQERLDSLFAYLRSTTSTRFQMKVKNATKPKSSMTAMVEYLRSSQAEKAIEIALSGEVALYKIATGTRLS